MNIKSLLFGSAAALVAVSGARAADAVVVAEPEPAEYVKICDVYGAGYYYIPGTETCLNIGGYVRVTVGAGGGDLGGRWGLQDVFDKSDIVNGVRPAAIGLNDTWSWQTKADVHFDARSETELGTLRSYFEASFNNTSGTVFTRDSNQDGINDSDPTSFSATGWALEHAYIQLGGLTIGYSDSLFESITESAGGNVMDDSIVGYTPGKANFVSYTFDAGNGFAATIGLEAGAGANYIDSYVPHVVVGATYTQGWGSVEGVVGYDSNYSEWAGKLRVNVNINEQLSAWVMGGLASGNDSAEELANHYNAWQGDWAVWGGFDYKFNDKGILYAQLSYTNGNEVLSYSKDVWGAAVGVKYTLVPGFFIKPEVSFASAKDAATGDRNTGWGAAVRFQRSF